MKPESKSGNGGRSLSEEKNIVWTDLSVTRTMREGLGGHKGAVLWFTGLPCSGKSTLARAVEANLWRLGHRTFVLDGDNVRHGLCSDLGFTAEDRVENIRRISEVAGLFLEAGTIVITAFISPFRADRDRARSLAPNGDFIEIFCDSPLEICEDRDVKGHYKRARAGEIQEFTGVSSPYEPPAEPELKLDTARFTVDECVDQVVNMLVQRGVISEQTNTSNV